MKNPSEMSAPAPDADGPAPTVPNRRSLAGIGLVVLGCALLVGLAGVGYRKFQEAQETACVSVTIDHLAAIDRMLWAYAQEHNGRYPETDASGRPFTNSNEFFRALLASSKENNEEILTVPGGPTHADGQLGEPPGFSEAAKPGECHWAVAKGVKLGDGFDPLVWENSLGGGWNPTWDPTLDRDEPGSTSSRARIFILSSDLSIRSYKLAEMEKPSRLEKLGTPGPNLFERVQPREVLDPVGLKRK